MIPPRFVLDQRFHSACGIVCWLQNMTLTIFCDLFGMVTWPFRRLSDLQLGPLGDEKVTLNHLDRTKFRKTAFCAWTSHRLVYKSQLGYVQGCSFTYHVGKCQEKYSDQTFKTTWDAFGNHRNRFTTSFGDGDHFISFLLPPSKLIVGHGKSLSFPRKSHQNGEYSNG